MESGMEKKELNQGHTNGAIRSWVRTRQEKQLSVFKTSLLQGRSTF